MMVTSEDFGADLEWERLDGKQACRIAKPAPYVIPEKPDAHE